MEKLVGGMRIRNPKTGATGTLAIIVKDQSDMIVGLTCHHVAFGKIGDEMEALDSTGTWSHMGQIADGSADLDVAVIYIDSSKWNVTLYHVEEAHVPKLSSKTAAVGKPAYIFGAKTDKWVGGQIISLKKARITVGSTQRLSQSGDSGAAWVMSPKPYTLIGIHYWGSDNGASARMVNIAKVIQRFNLVDVEKS